MTTTMATRAAMSDDLLLSHESAERMLRSCLAYRREHPDWRGRSLRLAYSLLHWWGERDLAVNDCLDRQQTIDDLRARVAELEGQHSNLISGIATAIGIPPEHVESSIDCRRSDPDAANGGCGECLACMMVRYRERCRISEEQAARVAKLERERAEALATGVGRACAVIDEGSKRIAAEKRAADLTDALTALLDADDRAYHGYPLPAEHWYAVRDAARAALSPPSDGGPGPREDGRDGASADCRTDDSFACEPGSATCRYLGGPCERAAGKEGAR